MVANLAANEKWETIGNRKCPCSEKLQTLRNCRGDRGKGELIGGVTVARCPLALLTVPDICEPTQEMIEAAMFSGEARRHYSRYAERGLLPVAGGTGDQPAKIMSALDIIDGEIARIRADEAKKHGR